MPISEEAGASTRTYRPVTAADAEETARHNTIRPLSNATDVEFRMGPQPLVEWCQVARRRPPGGQDDECYLCCQAHSTVWFAAPLLPNESSRLPACDAHSHWRSQWHPVRMPICRVIPADAMSRRCGVRASGQRARQSQTYT